MLIIIPADEYHHKSFINLDCVESCTIGEEHDYDDGYGRPYKPFYVHISGYSTGEMVCFETLAEAEKLLNDIIDAYARGDKVFRINRE